MKSTKYPCENVLTTTQTTTMGLPSHLSVVKTSCGLLVLVYLYRGKARLPLAGGSGLKVGLVADVPVPHPHSHYHYLLQLEWKYTSPS